MDQDYGLMRRMSFLRDVYNTVKKLSTLIGDSINTDLSTNERVLLGHLQEQKLL